ncbi:hypothetical protein LTR62_005875 [Meristemomyces frigidus]|uniref:DNA-directed RNA polymerase n=1 Tax=Meristemomyces frigidus TaxID=1508187 RepID=A0AAN7THE3_9PEZI|nr:hypothetical protein LTR62_005875 [Meristemomyces frigidus]
MLLRSAGRRQHHTNRTLASSFEQLNLPWLAPAQVRWAASQSHRLARTPPLRRRAHAPRLQQYDAQTRQLATAPSQISLSADSQYPVPEYSTGFRDNADSNIPWGHASPPQPTLSTIQPYKSPIVLNTEAQTPPVSVKIRNGLQGTSAELLQHLYTCLRVGRLNRAELIIQRLSVQSLASAPELIHAHTAYLEEMLRTLASQANGSSEAVTTWEDMQRWFKTEVREKDVIPDAKMLVVMIRAAIQGLNDEERNSAIREYVAHAEALGEETLDDVLYSEDYDDDEFLIMGVASADLYQDETEVAEQAQESHEEGSHAQNILQGAPHYHARDDLMDTAELPEVRATQQAGTGLSNVKRAMQDFINMPPPSTHQPQDVQKNQAYERQRVMEETSVDIALEKWKEADDDLRRLGINTGLQSRPVKALMWQWYSKLLPLLEHEMREVKRSLNAQISASASARPKDEDRQHYGPFLELLSAEKIAANTILYVVTKMVRGKDHGTATYDVEMKLNSLTTGLGQLLERETIVEASIRKLKEEQREAKSAGVKAPNRRLTRRLLLKGKASSQAERRSVLGTAEAARMQWPLIPKLKLGAMLVEKLIESAQLPVTRNHPRTKEAITQMQPAFLHRIKYVSGKKIGIVVPNPDLVTKLESEPSGAVLAKRMPMVVEPKPWSAWSTGGYLHYPIDILRLKSGDKSCKDYFHAADRKRDLNQVYAGLTVLGKVPWKVHPGVLKAQIEAWNSGEEIANFAPLNPHLPRPEEPGADADPLAKRHWIQEIKGIENKRAGLHSKRCFQNFQLEIARAVANETLYFPHNMDFRGRAYPIPPYLNHMGADNVRGLLVFAEGKPLGKNGLRWLKIHLATVAGHDKASLAERIAFTDENIDNIRDSSRNPLGGSRWWLKSEDAWQTLAACHEITAALDSPDPTKFLSTVPIQQDGTCNGLQHYAALGGDSIGARQVNLEPGDRPADVYTAVMEAVASEVEKDAAAGNPVAQKLRGKLTRKCVKQPVMTNVYGVTFFGAKEQVAKQLETIFPDTNRYDEIRLNAMSLYVVTKIFRSLGEMFNGAQAIQHWLGTCADRIATCLTPEQIKKITDNDPVESEKHMTDKQITARAYHAERKVKLKAAAEAMGRVKRVPRQANSRASQNTVGGSNNSDKDMVDDVKPLFRSTVIWTTPLRLPVVQPYRKSTPKLVKTNFQTFNIQEPQVWDPVSKRKQLQAFPPNFIHSLDATHMLLSALKCDEEGMTFASVHDSFWTHACDVDRLSVLLRDAFVEMHSEDIIGRLKEEFQTRYQGGMYLVNVLAKSPVGLKIAQWRKANHAFGARKSAELKLEAERMRLLQSEDPEDRARGQSMVTPGSILESEGDTGTVLASSALSGQGLGDMPTSFSDEAAASHNPEALDATMDDDCEAPGTDADTIAESPEAATSRSEGTVPGSVLDTDVEVLANASSRLSHDAGDDMMTTLGQMKAQATKKKHPSFPRKTFVWMPMAFPDVPPKGEFDVRRLKASQYFFH